jgi:hypothetical protein
MSHITFTKPAALATDAVQSILQISIAPDEPACNLNGSGTLSWLLQYDIVKGVVTVGAGKPTAPFGGPYSFVHQTSPSVAPAILEAPFTGCAIDATSEGGEVVLPVYLDSTGQSAVYLPFHDLRLMTGFVSADHSCIGTYNAAGLDPANACNPDATHPQFIDGGYLSAYGVLSEDDNVIIPSLNASLCALLTGNASMYGQPGPNGVTVCAKAASGQILFQGDWCSTTNGPATSTCADAVQVVASFAASGVTIQ